MQVRGREGGGVKGKGGRKEDYTKLRDK